MPSIVSWLDPEIASRMRFLLYRYRFLIVYLVIGVLSLVLELLLYRGLERTGLPPLPAMIVGFVAGFYFAFWTNVRFNFKVPKAKRNRALVYFAIISAGSLAIQMVLRVGLTRMSPELLSAVGWSYGRARFAISGAVCLLAYVLHRRFSFADYKKVGVAIYANGVEDIKGIYAKIGACSDFIHVDIIDSTFGESEHDPTTYRLEVVRAYWPRKPIHVHLMTREPMRWVDRIAEYVDTIFVHVEIDDEASRVLAHIREIGKRPGLCATMSTPVAEIQRYAGQLDSVMLLTIPTPGRSGQRFDMEALTRIQEINRWPERSRFDLCVDGGVSDENIHLLNVEQVVSGSSVLNSDHPPRQIMRLQTSNNYEGI